MLTLKDGPAAGTFMCRRAPVFLRGVVDGKTGESDVLDLLEDKPKDSELVYVYRRIGDAGTVHLHAKGASGWYAWAQYEYLQDVDGAELRENNKWQDWVMARPEAAAEQ